MSIYVKVLHTLEANKIKWHIKVIAQHDQVVFALGMQGCMQCVQINK